MDTETARTFLEIVRAGSFIKAGQHLHVTQTTITARVHKLEEYLGLRLFVRNRSGARLTAAGERFFPHALQLVQTWDKARNDMALPVGHRAKLTIGAEPSLWNPLVLNWLCWMREQHADVALHTAIDNPDVLLKHLEQGLLNLALVHSPDYFPSLKVEQLLEEKLIMVRAPHSAEPYIFVDWGPVFTQQHDIALPGRRLAAMTVNVGALALHYILRGGGSGYFRTRVVQPYLERGLLVEVQEAPEFTYPVYLLYATESNQDYLHAALAGLRTIAGTANDWSVPMAGN